MATRLGRRGSPLPTLAWGLALAGIGVTVASLVAAELLRRALEISFSNPLTRATYPWTARIDLVTIVVLVGSIAVLTTASLSPNVRRLPRPDWSRLVPWTVVVLVLAAAAGVTAGPPAAIGMLLLYPIVLWVGPRVADSDDPGCCRCSAWRSSPARWSRSALSAYGLPGRGHTVFDDEMAIYQGARQLEVFLWQGVGELTFEWRHLEGAQLDLTGAQFALFGDNFTLTRIINAALGTLSVAFVYGIAVRFRGATEARAAAVVAALWPTLVIWGGSGLREPLSIILTLLFPWLLVRRFGTGQRPFVVLAITTALITLLLLAVLRPPAALAMVAALLVAAVFTPLPGRRAIPRWAIVGVAVVVGVVVIGLSWRITRDPYAFMQQFTPRALEYRQAAAELTPLVEGDRTRLPKQPDPSFMVLATIVRAVPPGGTDLATGVLYWYTYDPPGYRVLFEDGTQADLLPNQVYHLTDETVGWSDVAQAAVAGDAPGLRARLSAGRRAAHGGDGAGHSGLGRAAGARLDRRLAHPLLALEPGRYHARRLPAGHGARHGRAGHEPRHPAAPPQSDRAVPGYPRRAAAGAARAAGATGAAPRTGASRDRRDPGVSCHRRRRRRAECPVRPGSQRAHRVPGRCCPGRRASTCCC